MRTYWLLCIYLIYIFGMEQSKKPRMSLSDALAKNVGVTPLQSTIPNKNSFINNNGYNLVSAFASSKCTPSVASTSFNFANPLYNFNRSFSGSTFSSNFKAFPFPTVFNFASSSNVLKAEKVKMKLLSSSSSQVDISGSKMSSLTLDLLRELSEKGLKFIKQKLPCLLILRIMLFFLFSIIHAVNLALFLSPKANFYHLFLLKRKQHTLFC